MVQLTFGLDDEKITVDFPEHYTVQELEYIEPIITEIFNFLVKNSLILKPLEEREASELFSDVAKTFKEIIDRINSYGNGEKKSEILSEIKSNFIKNIKDALCHLLEHKLAVCKIAFENLYINSDECFIKKIITTGSDAHCGGKTVLIFELQCMAKTGKIVHKPFSVLIDFLLLCNMSLVKIYDIARPICQSYDEIDLQNSLAGMINQSISIDKPSDPRVSTYVILPIRNAVQLDGTEVSEEYGFIEHIDHIDPMKNLDSKFLYYDKLWNEAGMIAGLVWLTGMNDAHHENILLCESLKLYLIKLIDSENSFLPNVSFIKSCLYSSEYGGFSFFENLENVSMKNRKAFQEGVRAVFAFAVSKNYWSWLNQPLLKKVNIRVVPIKTHDFTMKRKMVITKRLAGQDIEKVIQGGSLVIPYPQQSDHNSMLPDLPPNNSGYPLVIYSGENILGYVTTLYHGDIPVYHMNMMNTYLLDDKNKIIFHPRFPVPFNYFLLSPLQAAHNKSAVLKNNQSFKKMVEKILFYNFECLFSKSEEDISEVLNCLDRYLEVMFFFLNSQRLHKKYAQGRSNELDDVFFAKKCLRLLTEIFNIIISEPNKTNEHSPVLAIILNLFSPLAIKKFQTNLDDYLDYEDINEEESQQKITYLLHQFSDIADFFHIDIKNPDKEKIQILSDLNEKICTYMMNYNEVYFENAEKERKFQTALENTANASLFSGDSSQSNFFSNSASMQSVHAESSSDIQGLSRISLPKDDHCLYRAVSLYLFDADVPSLRLIVAKTLENNLDYFLEFIQLPQNVPMQQLIENIRSGNEWAGEVEIQILMHILQRPIVVLDNNGKIRNQAGIEQYLAQPPIFVYYDDVNHYDGLLLNENNGRELLEQLQLEQNNAASASNRNAVISNQ